MGKIRKELQEFVKREAQGRLRTARSLIREMRKRGFKPTPRLFAVLKDPEDPEFWERFQDAAYNSGLELSWDEKTFKPIFKRIRQNPETRDWEQYLFWRKPKQRVYNNLPPSFASDYIRSLRVLSRKHNADDAEVVQGALRVLRNMEQEAILAKRGNLWIPRPDNRSGYYPIIEKVPYTAVRTMLRKNTSEDVREKARGIVAASTEPFHPLFARRPGSLNEAQRRSLLAHMIVALPHTKGRYPALLGKRVPGELGMEKTGRSVISIKNMAPEDWEKGFTMRKFALTKARRDLLTYAVPGWYKPFRWRHGYPKPEQWGVGLRGWLHDFRQWRKLGHMPFSPPAKNITGNWKKDVKLAIVQMRKDRAQQLKQIRARRFGKKTPLTVMEMLGRTGASDILAAMGPPMKLPEAAKRLRHGYSMSEDLSKALQRRMNQKPRLSVPKNQPPKVDLKTTLKNAMDTKPKLEPESSNYILTRAEYLCYEDGFRSRLNQIKRDLKRKAHHIWRWVQADVIPTAARGATMGVAGLAQTEIGLPPTTIDLLPVQRAGLERKFQPHSNIQLRAIVKSLQDQLLTEVDPNIRRGLEKGLSGVITELAVRRTLV